MPTTTDDHFLSDMRLVGLYVATNYVAPPLIHQTAVALAEHGWPQTGKNVERWTEPILKTAFFYRSLRRQRQHQRLLLNDGTRSAREELL